MNFRSLLIFAVLVTCCISGDCLSQSTQRTAVPEKAGEVVFKKSKTTLNMPTFTSVESFSQFAPLDANVLFVFKPKQLFDFKGFETNSDKIRSSLTSIYGYDLTKIELVLVAANRQKVQKAYNEHMTYIFDRVANALNKDTAEVKSKPPTFDQGICGIVRFTEPMSARKFKNLIEQGIKSPLDPVRWRGVKMLALQDRSWSGIQLDDRTFLICNREELARTVEATTTSDSLISNWLNEYKSNRNSEVFVAGQTGKLSSMGSSFLLPSNFQGDLLSSLVKLEAFNLSVAMKETNFAHVEMSFPEPENSEAFMTAASNSLEDMKKQFEGLDVGPEAEFHSIGIPMLRSMKLSRDDKVVSFKVPRPADLEKMVEAYVDQMYRPAAMLRGLDHIENEEAFAPIDIEEIKSRPRARSKAIHAVKIAPVVVLVRKLDTNEVIQKDDVKVENWPAQLVPKNAVSRVSSVVGKKTSSRMGSGMPIIKSEIK